MNKSDILFRPHALHKIVTTPVGSGITELQLAKIKELEAKGSKITEKQLEELNRLIAKRDAPPELSETCKKYLIEMYVFLKYGRETDIQSRYIKKGLHTEEDCITLYSRFKKQFYKKNEERITNDYFSGEPDMFEGESITNADVTIDTKSCWDLLTFNNAKYIDKVKPEHKWQGVGYQDLTGARKHIIAYCLVNLPPVMLEDMKRRLQWDMGIIDPDNSPEYLEAAEKLDKQYNYDDIPIEDRIYEVVIDRNETDIKHAKSMCDLSRDYMINTFSW